MIAAAASTNTRHSGNTKIRNLNSSFYQFQRHNVPFTITNTTNGRGAFHWKILNLTTPGITATSTFRNPTFSLPEGHYLLYGEVQGLNPNPVARVFWHKRITVLGTKNTWDFELDLDNGNNIIDCSSWGDNIKVRANKLDATVGRIRFNNYNGTGVQFIVDEPMTINNFTGSSGLYFVNCNDRFVVDAVGDTDQHYITLDGSSGGTSHGIVINTVSDIRCSGIEIYGVKIDVTQIGASGIRLLGDESALYNRNNPPIPNFYFGHIWVAHSGHEPLYCGWTGSADGGFGGPPQFTNVQAWDWIVDAAGRDACQLGNCINSICHNWTINGCAGLGEPSHDSYIVNNPGNINCKFFNFKCKGGMHGINLQYGFTGANPFMWNIVMEVVTLPSQSTWNFLQVGDAPTSDMTLMNITLIVLSGDEIVYRFDSQVSQGSQDIDDLTLINCTTIKGASANFFTQDGTNNQSNFDIASGNLTYTPSTAATALLDATTHLPSSVSCPSISGGVAWTTRRTLAEMLGDYGSLEFQYDIDGYIIRDGQYPSGAGSGILLKLAAL